MGAHSSGSEFLASYPIVKSGPQQGAAFLYDNAVAAIALLARNEARNAARIGDAILAALDRDRYWRDGRLRNGFLAGPIGRGPVKLAGWWDARQNIWRLSRGLRLPGEGTTRSRARTRYPRLFDLRELIRRDGVRVGQLRGAISDPATANTSA
jgi:hypothetical protein